jgi:hypothetical protein
MFVTLGVIQVSIHGAATTTGRVGGVSTQLKNKMTNYNNNNNTLTLADSNNHLLWRPNPFGESAPCFIFFHLELLFLCLDIVTSFTWFFFSPLCSLLYLFSSWYYFSFSVGYYFRIRST